VNPDLEAVFRQEWGRAVAVVTRLTGDLGMAEDAVQEALAMALDRWPAGPLPSDPAGWLIAVAKNRALDQVRREARRPGKEEAAIRLLGDRDPPQPAGMIVDDRLRLIFTCCHPALDPGARVALTLRTLCGLSTKEIARAFLVSEAAIAQRLVRAKRKIRDAAIPYRVPADHELPGRIGGVLRVVYLVFTEGHRASSGERVVRDELCDEAIRLARLLAGLCPDDPEVLGLLAMLLLTDARRPARTAADGQPVLLEDQDRTLWDRLKIGEGTAILDRAVRRRQPGRYQIQAAIAACHGAAASAGDTDWAEIAALYTALAHHDPSPVVQANRAVAVAMADGPAAGLASLDEIRDAQSDGWHLLHACRADLLRRLGLYREAGDAYRAALALGPPRSEAGFLTRRLAEVDSAAGKREDNQS
jgi:RNA polymerase sigma-70 factor (ECF subfamily)